MINYEKIMQNMTPSYYARLQANSGNCPPVDLKTCLDVRKTRLQSTACFLCWCKWLEREEENC